MFRHLSNILSLLLKRDLVSERKFLSLNSRLFCFFIVAMGVLSVQPRVAMGQDGMVDPCFQTGRGVDRQVNALARQADGKIIIGGWFEQVNGCYTPRIARLNQDGSLDTSFNPGTGPNSGVTLILVQTNGKILISGEFTGVNGVLRYGIARLNTDGSLDTAFDAGPLAGLPPPPVIWGMAEQPDGKIIVCGNFRHIGGSDSNNIARLNPDGTSDTSFNTGNGAQGPPPSLYGHVFGLAVQSDGKILIGGRFVTYNSTPRNRIARLNNDGSLDMTFNVGSGANNDVLSIAVQNDGRILIGGMFSNYNGTPRPGISRLMADGNIDTSFSPASDAAASPNQIIVQPDGNILLGGSFTTFRIRSDGSVDPVFNRNNGTSIRDRGLSLQPDGKILVGGWFANGALNGLPSRVARLDSNGNYDPAFAARKGFNHTGSSISAVVSQPDGKILVGGGTYEDSGRFRYDIHRLTVDGLLDPVFDIGLGANNSVKSLTLQPDGKILIGGYFTDINGVSRSRIARLNSNGTVDSTFDPGSGASGLFSDTLVKAIALQNDGRIIVGGDFTTFNGFPHRNLVRLLPDGTVDPSFNSGSMSGNFSSAVMRIVIQPNGQILVAGVFNQIAGVTSNGVARLNQNGSVDTSFNVGNGAPAVYGLGLQSDGKVIIGGQFLNYSGNGSNNLVRLESNGSPDSSFYANIDGQTSYIHDLVIQRDGKIVVVGIFDLVSGVTTNCVARLNANGGLDTTFTPLRDSSITRVYAIGQQYDGKILFGGDFSAVTQLERWRVARLLNPSQNLTAATVSGRVVTPSGLGLRNAVVTLTNQAGIRQMVTTSTFGYFSFDTVPTNQTYTLTVASRRFRFSPQSMTVFGPVTNIELVGLE